MSDLSDSIDMLERLIRDRANEATIKSHLIVLRDRAAAVESTVESLQASNSALQMRIAELEQEAAKVRAANAKAIPRTERDPCPHCGQPRGRLTCRSPAGPPLFIEVITYFCEGCGETYEKREKRKP